MGIGKNLASPIVWSVTPGIGRIVMGWPIRSGHFPDRLGRPCAARNTAAISEFSGFSGGAPSLPEILERDFGERHRSRKPDHATTIRFAFSAARLATAAGADFPHHPAHASIIGRRSSVRGSRA